FRAQPAFTGTGCALRDRSGAETDRARHLRNLRDVGQTDPARAARSHPVRAIYCRMSVAARETEQGFARPAISHLALWSDRRSEEHTSELQSHLNLVCRLLLEKKNNILYE